MEEVKMEEVKLIIAVRKTIMVGVGVEQFRREWKELDSKDKDDLIKYYNESKCLGENVKVL